MGVTIRTARLEDAAAIAGIYNVEVVDSTVTFDLEERSLEAQRAWLSDRSGAHVVLAAVDDDGMLIGFGSLSPYRDRPAYRTTVEDSIYIHRDHHGKGVGKELLGALVAAAREHGFHAMIARAVGGHEASIGLHQSLGFELVGTERQIGRKFGKWLDVAVLQLLL